MAEIKLKTKDGNFICRTYKRGLEIVAYQGNAPHVNIPEQAPDTGLYLISIGKKAFLSCKSLQEIRIPSHVEEISDWAFAYCDRLLKVYMPNRHISFGRGVFQECISLNSIWVEGKHPDTAEMLGATVTILDTPFLMDAQHVGDEDWIAKWDARMLAILDAPDREGYSKLLLCGEEDYGSKENDFDYFLYKKRSMKVKLCYLRLLNPIGLDDIIKEKLTKYLLDHAPGKESDETWKVLYLEYGDDARYYKLFAEIGCLEYDNYEIIFREMDEKHPEMKAFFLKFKQENLKKGDFFTELLDF